VDPEEREARGLEDGVPQGAQGGDGVRVIQDRVRVVRRHSHLAGDARVRALAAELRPLAGAAEGVTVLWGRSEDHGCFRRHGRLEGLSADLMAAPACLLLRVDPETDGGGVAAIPLQDVHEFRPGHDAGLLDAEFIALV
jgi:hypothetical protein